MASANSGNTHERARSGRRFGVCDVRFYGSGTSRSEAQIVSYVVSGIGFLGAGVIFKDAGGVRGLNTAATIWCSAAIGAISGLGNPLHALILVVAVLSTNVVLRPLAYRLYPAQVSSEEQ